MPSLLHHSFFRPLGMCLLISLYSDLLSCILTWHCGLVVHAPHVIVYHTGLTSPITAALWRTKPGRV